jgi:hypothetical protein
VPLPELADYTAGQEFSLRNHLALKITAASRRIIAASQQPKYTAFNRKVNKRCFQK